MIKQIGLYILFSLFVICSHIVAQQQTYIVPFLRKDGAVSAKFSSMTILHLKKETESYLLKGIPATHPVYSIYYILVNNVPNRKDGNIRVKDTVNSLFKKKQKVYIYVGLNEERTEKYVIVDCNNDLDFGDEKLYTFSLKDYDIPSYSPEQYALCPEIKVKMSFRDCPDCCIIDLVVNPFYSDKSESNYDSKDQYYLDIGVFTNFYQQGILDIGGKKIYINESKSTDFSLPCPYEPINASSAYRFYQLEDTISPQSYSLGDTLSLVGRKIHIRAFDNNRLYLDEIGAALDSSRVGAYLPDLYSLGLSDDVIVHLNSLMKDKYVFIDFWGSWCGPCIAAIPALKEFYNRVKERDDVLVLGIALEHEKDIDKLKKIIRENNVEWMNVWNNFFTRKSLGSVHGKLRIDTFPTYMIIDKEGKIVYKDESIYKAQEAVELFMKLIVGG